MQEDLDIVDRYLEGNLSERERTAFEERLLQDEMLRQEVSEIKLIRGGIIRLARATSLKKLQDLEGTLPPVKTNKTIHWTNIWLQVAAGISLLAVCAYLLWPRTQEPTQIFAEHFEPYPNIIMPTVRGVVENDSTVKAQAFRAYDQQDYVLAIQLFEKLSVQDEAVLLYLGNSYLASGQPEKALLLFEKVLNNYEVFDEQAEWYVAVTYLKLEEREKAREALQKVVARNSSYKSKAQLILDKLN
jgi:tetratricopeptide (TPR) repeat protein